MANVKVKLEKIVCSTTEDDWRGDDFYLIGAISMAASRPHNPPPTLMKFHSKPVYINNGQQEDFSTIKLMLDNDETFLSNDGFVFDLPIENGIHLCIGANGYDEDGESKYDEEDASSVSWSNVAGLVSTGLGAGGAIAGVTLGLVAAPLTAAAAGVAASVAGAASIIRGLDSDDKLGYSNITHKVGSGSKNYEFTYGEYGASYRVQLRVEES